VVPGAAGASFGQPVGGGAPAQVPDESADSVGSWILTMLLVGIPVFGFIYLLILAFGSGHSASKRNWAKATLIWMVIGVVLGILLSAWIDDFSVVSGLTVGICLAITIVAWVLDYIAGILGAKKVGASREAIVGSFIGTIAGVFSGLWGLLFMPLLGAAIGQYLYDRDLIRARNVGIATWLGMVIGMLIKIALTFLMIGIFVFALVTP